MREKALTLSELKALPVYPPVRASEYLRRVRGMVIQPDSLRAIKRRRQLPTEAEMQMERMTLWTREELDAIEPTSWTKRVTPEEETADLAIENQEWYLELRVSSPCKVAV